MTKRSAVLHTWIYQSLAFTLFSFFWTCNWKPAWCNCSRMRFFILEFECYNIQGL